MKFLICLAFLFISLKSQAWMIDLNAELGSDTLSTTSEEKDTRQTYFLGVLGDISKGDTASTFVGWGVINANVKNTNNVAGTDQTFSTLDTGPLFRLGLGSRGTYSFSLMYALVAKGKLDSGGTSGAITGSSYLIKFAIEPEVADKVCVGFAMNYYAASYSKSVTSSVESNISYKIQRTFPSVSLTYRF